MQERGEGGGTAAVALVPDLLFASRIRGAAAAAGVEVLTVGSADRLIEEVRRLRPRLVLVDLEARHSDATELIARLRADPETAGVEIVAFGPHVNRERLQAARDAGASRVLARSAFVRELPPLLRRDPSP